MKPWGNSILIELDPESSMTHSGVLYKPEGANEDVLRTGKVLKVGPGRFLGNTSERTPMEVKPGDGVLFVKFLASFTETAKAIKSALEENQALLQLSDILLVFDRDDAPEFGG